MEKHFDETNNVQNETLYENMNNAESCTESSAALMSHCILCKDRDEQETACIACFDIAMPDVNAEKGVSVSTLEVPCCKDCRRHYQITKYIPPLIAGFLCIITIAVLSVRGVYDFLASKFFALPLVTMLAMVVISFSLASVIKTLFIRSFSKKTHMNILETDEYSVLKKNGAVEINAKSSISQPVFSNEHLSE